MPKKKIERPQREMTKRQLSHWQRESRMQRFIMIAGVVVVVAILAIVGTGIYMSKYKPYQADAIKVDNKKYSMDYYIDLLAYLGMMNGGTQLIQYMTDMTVTLIEQNQFYIQEAAKQFGITVSDDEVKQELEKNKVAGNQARKDFVRARLMGDKLKDYFDKNKVPAAGDQRKVEAMFLESDAQAKDVIDRININNEQFGDIAAQLSLESQSKSKRGEFSSVPKGVLPDLIDNAETSKLEDKVFSADIATKTLVKFEDPDRSKEMGYWLIKSTDAPVTPAEGQTPTPTTTTKPGTDLHIMVMLLNSKAKADDMVKQLNEGADFITLAKANSQFENATDDGGDMGMLGKDDLKTKFGESVADLFYPKDTNVQALPLNQLSDPIADSAQTTRGGVWLLRVGELENKTIEGTYRDSLIKIQTDQWQTQVWNDNQDKCETIMTQAQKTWAVTEATLRAK